MSSIRQRPSTKPNPDGDLPQVKSNGHHSVDKTDTKSPKTIVLVLLGSVLISLVLVSYRSSTKTLPESYALCSHEEDGIYTVDGEDSRVQCLVVHQAQVFDRGSLDDVKLRWKNAVKRGQVTDASSANLEIRFINPGSIVVPGLSDSHAHILEYGSSRQLPLEGAKSVEAAVGLVHQYIKANPDFLQDKSKFVEGWGWDHTSWPKAEWPTAADLEADPLFSGRPVVLQSKDGHALWVSTKVLEAMGPLPEFVEGGVIVRNEAGKATGVFLDNAQDLVIRPAPTEKDLIRRFSFAVQDAVANGLTSVHDAGFSPKSLAFFKRQADEGNMPIRVYGMTFFDENAEYWGNQTDKLVHDGTGRLAARSVKIFADGALRSGGAALYEPYTDNPETNGFMRLSEELLNSIIPKFLSDGWQVNVHAIGDRANGIVLDAFEVALKGVNVSALRPRLEHAQILTEADMARIGKLGVIASVQPTHAISDMWYAQDRLGPERVKGLYAFRSIIDHGGRITLGSDFPVEDMNPLSGFYAAVTRVSPRGESPHGPGGWFPDQRLTRTEALRGMTIDPAYASFTETKLGSLEPGKRADFVVLSQDIMVVAENKILDTKVLATVIDGRPAYGEI
ncbi:hypothetical protein JAAARDRAFT_35398 [Jaapia argillacea MUCL 33604]|uniref:Amidohydrolase 3 domain-containing protein n=1 Tax=Jaapia argillacea MUCL 33604 TaxID=933084 RepID=A0A067Q2J4_9AGAM|nr:hypothetical protein JAAARDRAFT_35398 [Jaapia argillacea MUCL 33604]